jgi:hypothetical protein
MTVALRALSRSAASTRSVSGELVCTGGVLTGLVACQAGVDGPTGINCTRVQP